MIVECEGVNVTEWSINWEGETRNMLSSALKTSCSLTLKYQIQYGFLSKEKQTYYLFHFRIQDPPMVKATCILVGYPKKTTLQFNS